MRGRRGVGGEPPASADGSDETLLLTPARHGTDGFFIAVLCEAGLSVAGGRRLTRELA